jgi:hypothetical protein
MGIITADSALLSVLRGLKERMEIRDSTGTLLGYYTPREQAEAEFYERAKACFDPAETERIAVAERGQGRPLGNFLKELEARGSAG